MNWEIISPIGELIFNVMILYWCVSNAIRIRRLEERNNRECYE